MKFEGFLSLVFCLGFPFTVLALKKGFYKTPNLSPAYDFIIIGGGTAGCVLASRLSEDEKAEVLLLEAGAEPSGMTEVPLFAPLLLGNDVDWGYFTEPQDNFNLGTFDHRGCTSRHKALGGCGSSNFMFYGRGDSLDYNNWSRNGAVGWNWESVLPYFKKSENQTDSSLIGNGFHGTSGPMTTGIVEYHTPGSEALLKASTILGLNYTDYNTGSQLGISRAQSNIRNGKRCSSEVAFLRPASKRPNLHVLTNAHVTKINFDNEKRATSVTFIRNNQSQTVSATREIILSAGTFGSPQLLLLSGIGPKDQLLQYDIPLVADLPVGENLHDHILCGGLNYLLNDSVSVVYPRDVNPQTVGELEDEGGPLTLPGAIELIAFFESKYQDPSKSWPDMQLFSLPILMTPFQKTLKKEIRDIYEYYSYKNVTSIVPVLVRPKSRGFLKLRSANPFDAPVIDPKYITEKVDLDISVEGMKMGHKWMMSDEMKKYSPKRIPEVVPGCEETETESDAFWECVVRHLAYPALHFAGTCKMGDPADESTVVDPQLRVKGVQGLRVADASIMPTIVSVNTNGACVMIAEKAADMIRGL